MNIFFQELRASCDSSKKNKKVKGKKSSSKKDSVEDEDAPKPPGLVWYVIYYIIMYCFIYKTSCSIIFEPFFIFFF